MIVLGWSIGLLAAAWLLHVLLWRIYLPANHTRGLLVLFALAPFPLAWIGRALALPMPLDIIEWLSIAAFYLPCVLSYIIFYSILESQSPTCAMVLMLHDEGGLNHDVLITRMDAGSILQNRLQGLIDGGMATYSPDGYTLTPKGITLAKLFTLSAILFGISRHGG